MVQYFENVSELM